MALGDTDSTIVLVGIPLGDDLRISWAGVKAYACCRGVHSSIDAVLGLQSQHHLRAEEIDSIVANCTPVQKKQLGRISPTTRLEAQFSLPYSVAVALIHGEAGYDYFTEDWIKNDDIGRLAQKVSMVSIEQRPLNEEPEIVITTKDGRTFRHQVDCALGDPTNPVSEQGILDKYIKLATRQTDLKTAETLKHLVLTIDQPRHLSRLRHLLQNDLRCVQI